MRWGIGEEAESGARIFRVGETKKSWNDLDMRVQRDLGGRQPLAPAVQSYDDQSQEEVKGARAIGHSTYCKRFTVRPKLPSRLSPRESEKSHRRVRGERPQSALRKAYGSGFGFQFLEDRAATFAHSRIIRVFPNVNGIVPAALALLSVCLPDLYLHASG